MTFLLGIDPGSHITGYGIIEEVGQQCFYVASGCIRLKDMALTEKLKQIYDNISWIIEKYSPQSSAIENVFMSKNADSALKLGQARASAIVAMVNHQLDVAEYSAKQIKQSVVGKGAADKQQVQSMVVSILKLNKRPPKDASDALAVAICHSHTRRGMIRLSGVQSFRHKRYSLQNKS